MAGCVEDTARGACIVGELATRFDVLPQWAALGGVDLLHARIAHLEASGYDGALLWSGQLRVGATWPDRATQWDEPTRAAVREMSARYA